MKAYIFEDNYREECENLSGIEIKSREESHGKLLLVAINGKKIPCHYDKKMLPVEEHARYKKARAFA